MNREIVKIDGKRYEVVFEYDGDHLDVEDDYTIESIWCIGKGFVEEGTELLSDIISALEEKRIGSIEETKAVKSVYWEER